MFPPVKIVIKTTPKGYPESFSCIGDHLRAERLTEGLQIVELALQLRTSPENIVNWEQGNNTPSVNFMGSIIEYLSYCPLFEQPKSLGQQVKLKRFHGGLSSEQLAYKMGIDQSTLLRWEGRGYSPQCGTIKKCFELYMRI